MASEDRLIGFCGPAGAGKDTAFQYVFEWFGQSACRRGFADLLKWSFARLFVPDCTIGEGIALANRAKFNGTLQLADNEREGEHEATTVLRAISGRLALQRYGTEGHRDVFGDNFWVDALLPLGEDEQGVPNWVSSFLGPYSNLHNAIVARDFSAQEVMKGGKVAPEFRPPIYGVITDLRFENEAQRIKELGGKIVEIARDNTIEANASHSSEAGVPEEYVDYTLLNDGSLADFRQGVFDFLDKTYGKGAYVPADAI